MDNYPKHLTPPKNERGNIDLEKFGEWWSWAQTEFPTVPENAAHYWLHENWGVSPYSYMKSRNYEFEAVKWPSIRLRELLSESDDFDPEHTSGLRYGYHQCHNNEFGIIAPLAKYMMEFGRFPEPIVILDNQDGHLQKEYDDADRVPTGFVLIEGHTRLDVGLYLQSTGKFGPTFDAWLMTKIPA
jgi:hypothetical protein